MLVFVPHRPSIDVDDIKGAFTDGATKGDTATACGKGVNVSGGPWRGVESTAGEAYGSGHPSGGPVGLGAMGGNVNLPTGGGESSFDTGELRTVKGDFLVSRQVHLPLLGSSAVLLNASTILAFAQGAVREVISIDTAVTGRGGEETGVVVSGSGRVGPVGGSWVDHIVGDVAITVPVGSKGVACVVRDSIVFSVVFITRWVGKAVHAVFAGPAVTGTLINSSFLAQFVTIGAGIRFDTLKMQSANRGDVGMCERASVGKYGRMAFATMFARAAVGISKVAAVFVGGAIGKPSAIGGWSMGAEAGVGVWAEAGPGSKGKAGVERGGVAEAGGVERRRGAKTV